MGYTQTDDRDDYFNSLNKKRWINILKPDLIVYATCKTKAIKLLNCTRKECKELTYKDSL